MKQDRMKKQSDRGRTDMEPTEGSREQVRGSGSSGSSERGRGDSSGMQSGTGKGSSGDSARDLDREEFERDRDSER